MFYLYPITAADIFGVFEVCKVNSTAHLHQQAGIFKEHSEHKHGDDIWFYDAVQQSTHRTMDPSKASLFVIPALVSLVLRSSAKHGEETICGVRSDQYVSLVQERLDREPYFNRSNGADHLFCASDWRVGVGANQSAAWLRQSMRGTFESRILRDITVPYVSQIVLVPQSEVGAISPNDRTVHIFFAGKTLAHRGYASRRLFCDMVDSHHPKATVCYRTHMKSNHRQGTKPSRLEKVASLDEYFKNLQISNFSAMIRGDTPTSGRLYDMFVTGTVPLLLSDNIWGTGLPFPEKVPWQRLLISVEEQQTLSMGKSAAAHKVS